MKDKDVMARNPVSVASDDLVSTALDLMRTRRIRHLPVVDDASLLVGIVTDRDLRHAALTPALQEFLSARARRRGRHIGEALESLRVRDVMTWAVVTTGPEAPLLYAALIMTESRVGSLPVLADGHLVGLLTEQDVLKALMQEGGVAEFDDAIPW